MNKQISAFIVALLVTLAFGQPARAADEASEAEYKERLARYDFKNEPDDHKKMAAWCKRSYPTKYHFHVTAYNKYLFSQDVARLPATPTANHYKTLEEKALKLELPEEAQHYLGKWGELQYAGFEKRLKPGDVKMMKQLIEWCEKNKIGFIPPARKLAAEILTHDAEYALSRKLLGHIQWKGGWTSLEDAIASIKITSIQDRIALHKAAADARSKIAIDYPAKPFQGMDSQGGYYLFSPRKSPGAQFFVHANGYSAKKPCRLILSLHGGGGGDFAQAKDYASIAIKSWTRQRGDHVVLTPIATRHVVEAWRSKSNTMEILDAMEEICERFNIDRKRIYVTGHSMGGAGTTTWYNAFPEFAAASCGRAGWFYFYKMQGDLLKKPIMIIQGESDTAKRVKSKQDFLKMASQCNGNVTNISLKGFGHDLPDDVVYPKFLPFFDEHTNDIEPDFDVIRAAARKWMTDDLRPN